MHRENFNPWQEKALPLLIYAEDIRSKENYSLTDQRRRLGKIESTPSTYIQSLSAAARMTFHRYDAPLEPVTTSKDPSTASGIDHGTEDPMSATVDR